MKTRHFRIPILVAALALGGGARFELISAKVGITGNRDAWGVAGGVSIDW